MSTQLHFLQSQKQSSILPSLHTNLDDVGRFLSEKQVSPLGPQDLRIQDVTVRHLKSAADISEIQYLRGEINLDLHRILDPHFAEHEKKGMS